MDTAGDDEYYRDDSLCEPDADFIILSAEGHYTAESGNKKAWLFKVKKSSLMRHSTVFRDMLEVGTAEFSKDDLIDGLPFVRLEEDPKALKDFLTFFKDDSDKWLEIYELVYQRTLACWTLALKYDTVHVRYICELEICRDDEWEPNLDDLESLAKGYATAVLWHRSRVEEKLLRACRSFNIDYIDKEVLYGLPPSVIDGLWRARLEYLQENFARGEKSRKTMKDYLHKLREQKISGHVICSTTEAQKIFKEAMQHADYWG